MSNKALSLHLSYKDSCIVKHALRDKQRDSSEEKVYQYVCQEVQDFKKRNRIPDKPHIKSEYVWIEESSELTQEQMNYLSQCKREFLCASEYKELHCGYKGELPTCNKSIEDCKQHGNIARFGGFLPIGCG